MSEFAWNPEIADQPEAEHSEPEEKQLDEPAASAETLALSVNDFSALEEKILRAVNMVKRERQARTAVEERLAKAEAQLREQAPLAEQLRSEINALRAERDQVKHRVERLLGQLDALEL
jgi:FtsZ-binding cell division protein ZapB